MSADLMLVCEEDDSSWEGKHAELAFCAGETSMGSPHDGFSQWLQSRFDGSASVAEQLLGSDMSTFTELTNVDVESVMKTFDSKESKSYVKRDKLEKWLTDHIGKHVCSERW